MATADERAGWRELHRSANEELRERLVEALDALVAWTRKDPALLARRPRSGAWSGLEVLEHVALSNRFLLVLAGKVRARSRARLEAGDPFPTAPPDLEVVARSCFDSRPWPAPEHMLPTGSVEPDRVRPDLAGQLERCLAFLVEMPSGEGTLHRIRFSRISRGDDRLDLYQWLELIARHAERHTRQLERATA